MPMIRPTKWKYDRCSCTVNKQGYWNEGFHSYQFLYHIIYIHSKSRPLTALSNFIVIHMQACKEKVIFVYILTRIIFKKNVLSDSILIIWRYPHSNLVDFLTERNFMCLSASDDWLDTESITRRLLQVIRDYKTKSFLPGWQQSRG